MHLHVHTEYSLADGAIFVEALIRKIKSLGHHAVAMTDTNNLSGAIEFYLKAREQGIKPILGAEIFQEGCHTTVAHAKKQGHTEPKVGAFHLVLLARNIQGYRNIIKIVSSGWQRIPVQTVPIIEHSALQQFSGDIIALSGCLRGEFAYLISELQRVSDKGACDFGELHAAASSSETIAAENVRVSLYSALKNHVEKMELYFGRGNYYIEIIDNNLPEQKSLLPLMIAAAKHFDLPLVATADAHYLDEDFSDAHTVLVGIKNELTMSSVRKRNKTARFHLFDNQEMNNLYGAWPEALQNTLNIAEQCNLQLEFGRYYLPHFNSRTSSTENVLEKESAEAVLSRLAAEGLESRFSYFKIIYGASFDEEKKAEYLKRLEYELDVIVKMGFPGYFLIVQDFINWAKGQGIRVGPGRGSGAGSLVAYALRITDLDPIRFNLLFERFLNPERISMPDFDVDFCQERRDEVLRYVAQRYGENNVAQITTFGKMQAKAVVRDVGRVMDIGYSKVDRFAKLIPNENGITLDQAIEREPKIREEVKHDPMIADLLHIAKKLEGLNRHTSVHAAGVVIADGPITDYVPIYKAENAGLITQYEMTMVEKVGLIKFDFLGLKTLTVIDKAIKLINRNRKELFDLSKINLEDPRVFAEVSKGHTVGIFQMEGQGMQQVILKLQPSKFEDLIATIALFRPGPMVIIDDFVERKHGRQRIDYLIPQLEAILKDSYGCFVYQEQVLQAAAVLANYRLGEADLLRRAMGKKKPEEMAQQKSRFISGCLANSISQGKAEEIFELMAKFAEYGFNKCHSAAYALICYQTAYLKTHFSEEFMAALMTCDMDITDKITKYVEECRRMGFKVLGPSVNHSDLFFDTPMPKTIRFGLAAIKGIGLGSVGPIIENRKSFGPFKTMEDFAKRVNLHKVGKKTLELLVQVGALDCVPCLNADKRVHSRSELLSVIEEFVKKSETIHEAEARGQRTLFESIERGNVSQTSSEATKLLPPQESEKDSETILNADIEWLLKEKKLLGTFISGHPMDVFKEDIKHFSRISIRHLLEMENVKERRQVVLLALLTGVKERLSKSNQRIIYVEIEDVTGIIEAIMFDRAAPMVFPPENTPIVVMGSFDRSFEGAAPRLIIEQLIPLEVFRRAQVKSLSILLKPQTNGKANSETASSEVDIQRDFKKTLDDLQTLVHQSKGDVPTKILLTLDQARLSFGEHHIKVNVTDDFIKRLNRLKKPTVQVEYSFSRQSPSADLTEQ